MDSDVFAFVAVAPNAQAELLKAAVVHNGEK